MKRGAAGLTIIALAWLGCTRPVPQYGNAGANGASDGSTGSGVVTRRIGSDADPEGSVSPDGRYVSYTDWTTGDLAVRDLQNGQSRRLTDKGAWSESGEYAEGSVFSPEGAQIAYGWLNQDRVFELRVIDLQGSAARVLFSDKNNVTFIWPQSWSPDGSQILAAVSRTDRSRQIALFGVRDGAIRALKSLDWRALFTGPFRMSFSPDGRYIAYDLPQERRSRDQRSRASDIYVLAADGSRETHAVDHPANDVLVGWTPDGRGLLFSSDRGGTQGVWLLPMAAGKPVGGPTLVRGDLWNSWPLGVARTGYYYGVDVDAPRLYTATLDPEGGSVVSGPSPIATEEGVFPGSADWSRDGQHLAYVAIPPGNMPVRQPTLAIRSLESGETRALLPDLDYASQLRWAPDGRSILVTGYRKTHRGLFRVDLETGATTPVVLADQRGGSIRHPAWSPDGRTIYFVFAPAGGSSRFVIVARDLATGQERELRSARGGSGSGASTLSLSRDGRSLVFTETDPATKVQSLRVMPSSGGEPRTLYEFRRTEQLNEYYGEVSWSADGWRILFVKGAVPPGELWDIPIAGGSPRRLLVAPAFGIRPHPDGRRVVFTSGPGKTELWVMENLPGIGVTGASATPNR